MRAEFAAFGRNARGLVLRPAITPLGPASSHTNVLDALPLVAWVGAPDGTITYVSDGWERLTGNSMESIVERGYADFIHPDDVAHAIETWDAARATRTSYRDEVRLRFADTAYRWVITQAEPIFAGGEIVEWLGTVTDIQDLRLAEERLSAAVATAARSAEDAATRAHFVERLLDASDDCVKVLDLDARIVSISPNGQRALQIMDFATVEGTDWLTFWTGADHVAARTAIEAARAGGRGRFVGEFGVGGRAKWWDVTVTPILGVDDLPEQLLAVSRDVTDNVAATRALAHSEERYRLIGQALPGVTWTATPDGKLDHIGGPAASNRVSVAERLGDAWLTTVHPNDVERTKAEWAAAIATGAPYETQFRVRTLDGTYRWQLVRANPQRDAGGAIVGWIGVNVDVDDRYRADEAREQFVRLAEASEDVISIADENGHATYLNDAGFRLLGVAKDADVRSLHLMKFLAAADRPSLSHDIMEGLDREGRWAGEIRIHARTGETIPIWYDVFSIFDQTGVRSGIATVARDLRGRYRVEAGLRALAEAGASMYRSLDFDGTVRNVANAVSQSFATYCTVDTLERDGSIRSVVATNAGPAAAALLERSAAARNRMAGHPVARAIKRGEATLISSVAPDWMETSAGAESAGLAIRSVLYVPIRSAQDGHIFGALSCGLGGDDPRGNYTADDLRFAEEIAVRAALAFDHARAYERERRIAVTMQEASLPTSLPTLANLSLSADYRPGNSEATIGGDWYDAFVLEDGRVVMTIGDVLGNGLSAAVTMGKLRQAMQSVGMILPDPNTMLAAADRTVRAHSSEMYATALAGIFDPKTSEFTFASAGHPGPALLLPDGRIEEFAAPGIILGLRAPEPTRTVTISTPPGSALVFYTDGLVEATRDVEEGHRLLHAAMSEASVAEAANPARALVEFVFDGQPASDDTAVLVAQIGPRPA